MKKSLNASLLLKSFGAKKCPEKLLSLNTLLLVLCSKTTNAKTVTGNIHTQTALLVASRLQMKNPSEAAIVILKSHSLVSTPDTECAWPISDQMEDSIVAVPRTAKARFSKNAPTERNNLPIAIF